jgi:hypothetical protein
MSIPQEGMTMDMTPNEGFPSAAAAADRTVEVLETSMRIHELSIERPGIIAYLQKIAPDKQEIALVHALEVGITELIARRERFQH